MTASRILNFFNNKPATIPLFLCFLVFCSYANSLYSPFVLDDNHSFIEERAVYNNDLSVESLKRLSETKFGITRLIPMITFAVDHNIFSRTGSIVQYHLTNIFIHIFTTMAIFLLIRSICLARSGRNDLEYFTPFYFSILVASFWALNPVQTNAVTYIVQRMASLCALFYVSSIACYVSARRLDNKQLKYALFFFSLLSALLAFLSKENAYTLPLAIIFSEYIFFSHKVVNKYLKRIKPLHWLTMLLLLIIIMPLLEPLWSKYTSYGFRNFTLMERLLTESRVIVFYISLVLLPLPSRLNFIHDFSLSTSILSPQFTLFSILLIVLLICIALYNLHKNRLLSYGIIFYFLTIFIESSFIPLELVFEHRLYLPSIGLFIALFATLDHIANRLLTKEEDTVRLIIVFSIFLISISSLSTTYRNRTWQDIQTLYRDSYLKSPAKPRALSSYGMALSAAGENQAAINLLGKCIDISVPKNEEMVTCLDNLMVQYTNNSRAAEAIDLAYDFVRRPDSLDFKSSNFDKLYQTLSIALIKEKRFEEAKQAKVTALQFSMSPNKINRRLGDLRSLMAFISLQKSHDASIDNYIEIYSGLPANKRIELNDKLALLISEILFEQGKYEFARIWLNKIEEKGKHQEAIIDLTARISSEEKLNSFHAGQYDIARGISSNSSQAYRTSLKISAFIIDYYRPLRPVAEMLLKKTAVIHGPDQYIGYLMVKNLYDRKEYQKALEIAESYEKRYPDFMPILDLQLKLYLQANLQKQLRRIGKHIINIYPGHSKRIALKKLIDPKEQTTGRDQ